MVLDGVHAQREVTWLSLARDKVAAFTTAPLSVPLDALPRSTVGSTVRPFPDPFPTGPVAGSTGQGTSVGLSWGASSGAASYAYCLDATLNGACTGTWQNAGTATTATVTGLTPSAT